MTETGVAPETSDGSRPAVQLDRGSRMAVLWAVMLGLFLAALDQTVVGTALPRITTDLGGSELYTWVVTVYLLCSTITVPIYGKLSDVYGRKPLLLIGISIFLLGSALCGLSQNMTELIVFRAIQGLGAGSLFPISLAVIGDLFTARERGRYQGLFGAVFGLSFIVGPFIGGILTDSVSWHWVFYVNLPVGLYAVSVIMRKLPTVRLPHTRVRDLDFLGVAVFVAAVVPLMLGLTAKGQPDAQGMLPDWSSPPVAGYLLASLVLGAAFVLVESRAREPIVPLSLFRDRTYAASIVATVAISTGMFAAVIYLPRYYQAVRGIGATASGYETWPLLVGLIGASVVSGQLISRTGRYKRLLIVSTLLVLLGMVLMTRMTADSSTIYLWAAMLAIGLGIGPGMSGFTTVVQNVAPMRMLGAATSTLTFFRQVGGSIGLAIAGTVFSSSFRAQLPGSLAGRGVPPSVAGNLRAAGGGLTNVGDLSGQLSQTLPPQSRGLIPVVTGGIHDAFAQAIGSIFWVGVVSAMVGVIAVVVMREVPLRGAPSRTEEAPAVAGPEAAAAALPVAVGPAAAPSPADGI